MIINTLVVLTCLSLTVTAVVCAVLFSPIFELELVLAKHFYIRVGSWDYWKQWDSDDIF
jgi:hypothetical protein